MEFLDIIIDNAVSLFCYVLLGIFMFLRTRKIDDSNIEKKAKTALKKFNRWKEKYSDVLSDILFDPSEGEKKDDSE